MGEEAPNRLTQKRVLQFVVTSTELNLAPFESLLLRGSVFFVLDFHTTSPVSSLLVSLSSSLNGPVTAGRRMGILAGKRPCSASLLIFLLLPSGCLWRRQQSQWHRVSGFVIFQQEAVKTIHTSN